MRPEQNHRFQSAFDCDYRAILVVPFLIRLPPEVLRYLMQVTYDWQRRGSGRERKMVAEKSRGKKINGQANTDESQQGKHFLSFYFFLCSKPFSMV